MISTNERKLILRWYKEGKNQKHIADLISCHQTSVSRLISKFNTKGTIENLHRSGRPTKLSKKVLSDLKTKLQSKIKSANKEYCNVSTKKIRTFIAQEIGEKYSIRHIERLMHKLGFSLITPRPQHIRHNQEKVDSFRDEFKKNSPTNIWVMKS